MHICFCWFFFRASDLLNMWQHDRLADSLKAIIYFYFGHEIGFRMSASSRCTWTILFGCASIHPKLNVLKLSSTADSTWTDICRGHIIHVILIHSSNRFRLFYWIPWKSLSTILSKCSIRNNIQLHEYFYKLLYFFFLLSFSTIKHTFRCWIIFFLFFSCIWFVFESINFFLVGEKNPFPFVVIDPILVRWFQYQNSIRFEGIVGGCGGGVGIWLRISGVAISFIYTWAIDSSDIILLYSLCNRIGNHFFFVYSDFFFAYI